jgi:glutathione S-transferase
LEIDGAVLTQSLAVLEYLEETRRDQGTALLPSDPIQKATVRNVCLLIAADTHPIQNLRVLNKIGADFGQDKKIPWAKVSLLAYVLLILLALD